MVRMVRIDTSSLNALTGKLQQLPQRDIPKAYVATLNRTLNHMYTQTSREVRQVYNVTTTEIKNSMSKRKPTYQNTLAWIVIRSKRFTLGRFLPGGLGSKSKKARVKIKRSSGYQDVGGDPGAFVRKITGVKKDGTTYTNTHIFSRQGRKRYPIDVLRTISPTQMVENQDVLAKVQQSAQEMAVKRLNHEIDRRLAKIAKGGS